MKYKGIKKLFKLWIKFLFRHFKGTQITPSIFFVFVFLPYQNIQQNHQPFLYASTLILAYFAKLYKLYIHTTKGAQTTHTTYNFFHHHRYFSFFCKENKKTGWEMSATKL